MKEFSLLHQFIEYYAESTPSKVAVKELSRQVTYKEFCSQMRGLASAILSTKSERNDRVGLLMSNSIEGYIGLYGILKADCCYVPLDPDTPSQRLIEIVHDSAMKVMVSTIEHMPLLKNIFERNRSPLVKSLVLLGGGDQLNDSDREFINGRFEHVFFQEDIEGDVPFFPSRNIEQDLAYIIYTSGTTGKPKGVMLSHANVKAYLRWGLEYFGFNSDDVFSGHPRLNFDLSVTDVFCCFSAGATMCPVVEPGERIFPGPFIKKMKITIWCSVPSVMGMLIKARQLHPEVLGSTLRMGIFCGEAMNPNYAEAWLENLPNVRLYNLYGPTEATVACSHYEVSGEVDLGRPIPIGRPNKDVDFVVLGIDSDTEVESGKIGRLMISSPQLAVGYWCREELTVNSFVNIGLPEFKKRMYDTGDLVYKDNEGCYHYKGRQDFQIKHMGYRIELGDIDSALCSHSAVNEAAACYFDEDHARIVGAVSFHSAKSASVDEIVEYCRGVLPSYMLPSEVHIFETLPKNQNGKIDRKTIMAMLS